METIRNSFKIDSKSKEEIESFIKDLVEKYIKETSVLMDIKSHLDELTQEVSNHILSTSSLGTEYFLNTDNYTENVDKIKEIIKEKVAVLEISLVLGIDKQHITGNNNVYLISPLPSTYPYNTPAPVSDKRLEIKKFMLDLCEKYTLRFEKCIFKCSINNIKQDNISLQELNFYDCIFLKNIIFSNRISKIACPHYFCFRNCNFEKEFQIKNATFSEKIILADCDFSTTSAIKIKRVIFQNKVEIYGCKINNINISLSAFSNDTFFNHSTINGYLKISQSTFEKNISFYGVIFNQPPNILDSVFKEHINLVNTNLNFTYENLQDKIKEAQKTIKTSSDFRDSFRLLKNALIKDNNLLDASNYHKNELYCKEIELDLKNPKLFSKEWIDKLQLFIYRNLCDHHTDLLKNIKWLICTVTIYAIMSGQIGKTLSVLCIFFLIFFYFCAKKILSWFVLAVFIMAIAHNPTIIFGIANIFSEKCPTYLWSHLWCNSTSVLYSIAMLLILFSLQKTARKNSIIPS